MGAPDHERQEGAGRGVELLVLVALADDDVAVGLLGLDVAHQPAGLGRRHAREQHVVVPERDLVGDVTEQLQEERVRDQLVGFVTERDRHPDGPRPIGPEPLGGLVDHIAAFGRDPLDLLPGLDRDRRAFRQGAGDGRGGHSGQTGDVRHLQRSLTLSLQGLGLVRARHGA